MTSERFQHQLSDASKDQVIFSDVADLTLAGKSKGTQMNPGRPNLQIALSITLEAELQDFPAALRIPAVHNLNSDSDPEVPNSLSFENEPPQQVNTNVAHARPKPNA